jgi:hypothetical protein
MTVSLHRGQKKLAAMRFYRLQAGRNIATNVGQNGVNNVSNRRNMEFSPLVRALVIFRHTPPGGRGLIWAGLSAMAFNRLWRPDQKPQDTGGYTDGENREPEVLGREPDVFLN